jgi:hypothetical protein
MLSSQHLLAEVTHRGGHGVDNGHDLLMRNDGVDSTSAAPQQHLGARGGRGAVHSSEARGAQQAGAGAAGDGVRRDDEGGIARDERGATRGAARDEMGCATGKTAAASA